MCYLCKSESESIDHIFIHCAFTKAVWQNIIISRGFKQKWIGTSLEICLHNWFENKFVPTNLASQVCWNIWLESNRAILEGSNPKVQKVYYKTLTHSRIIKGVK